MLRTIDQPYAAGVDVFLLRPWWSIGLSGCPMVPRPRRYSRPNRASRPSDAISLLYPSLLPGHQPVHPSPGLSSAVLNRARALRRAISKFPADKKENRYSLSSLPIPRIPHVDTSSHVPRHPAPRTRKWTRLAMDERARVIAARRRNPDMASEALLREKRTKKRRNGEWRNARMMKKITNGRNSTYIHTYIKYIHVYMSQK